MTKIINYHIFQILPHVDPEVLGRGWGYINNTGKWSINSLRSCLLRKKTDTAYPIFMSKKMLPTISWLPLLSNRLLNVSIKNGQLKVLSSLVFCISNSHNYQPKNMRESHVSSLLQFKSFSCFTFDKFLWKRVDFW